MGYEEVFLDLVAVVGLTVMLLVFTCRLGKKEDKLFNEFHVLYEKGVYRLTEEEKEQYDKIRAEYKKVSRKRMTISFTFLGIYILWVIIVRI